ncbi:hypothetical protein CMK12_10670 [Candidatus Poribacteria bacterium]|nr:hypothetical protein [Candidatus Poribacteria bacterium]
MLDLNFSFPTNNLPSTPVRPQFATILIFLGLLVFTLRTDQFNATFQPPLAERITVVPLIRYDADRILPRPTSTFSGHCDLLNRGLQPFYFTRRGRIKVSTDRDSLAIDHHHPPLPPLVFPRHGPLFLPRPNCHRPRFQANLTGPVAPVRTGI